MRLLHAAAALLLTASAAQAAGTLRVGLGEDPDLLDPARGGSYVGRIVFAALCDKLVDIDAKLNFVPQLATGWAWSADNLTLTLTLREGVKFQDGEPMDAEAVRINLERYRSATESVRKAEVRPISAIEVVDSRTLRLKLSAPAAPLVSVLADRAGMMASPKALARLGAEFGTAPVCAGPYKFTQRIAQDRIILDRFDGYWNAGTTKLDRITYLPIPDTSVRLVNLQSGQLDIAERMAPSDAAAVRRDPKLKLYVAPGIAYQALSLNLNSGPQSNTPFGRDPRVREAFEKSIDRAVLNQVVFEGMHIPSNQAEAPGTPYWNADRPVPPRDIAGAKALMKAAGVDRVSLTIRVTNTPISTQTGELIQSMAAEAGFDIKLQASEANAGVAMAQAGDYQMTNVIWSGRADPDGNIAIWLAKDGFLNWGKYDSPELNSLLVQARSVTDPALRAPLYKQVSEIYLRDRPIMILYHQNWIFGTTARLGGFAPVPDGLIRPQGLELRN